MYFVETADATARKSLQVACRSQTLSPNGERCRILNNALLQFVWSAWQQTRIENRPNVWCSYDKNTTYRGLVFFLIHSVEYAASIARRTQWCGSTDCDIEFPGTTQTSSLPADTTNISIFSNMNTCWTGSYNYFTSGNKIMRYPTFTYRSVGWFVSRVTQKIQADLAKIGWNVQKRSCTGVFMMT